MRIELGNTGSKTTIHRYLKEIEDFDPRPRASRERLSDELTELVAGLLERMTEEGGEALAYAQASFDEQRSELEQKLDSLSVELTSFQREVDNQKGALALQADELQICQTSLQAELTRNARLSQSCADLEVRVHEKGTHHLPVVFGEWNMDCHSRLQRGVLLLARCAKLETDPFPGCAGLGVHPN